MAYFSIGNIVDAGIFDEDRYVSAWGQILDGLSHLHAKGVAHRDLKPKNFLIRMDWLFTVVIADFGMAKIVTDTALLQTFCGSLMYAAPEVFPGLSPGHDLQVDIWSLGVIVFEWIYGIPDYPDVPRQEKKNEQVSPRKWYAWVNKWAKLLLNKLDDQESDKIIQILVHMIEIDVGKRWSAHRCLAQGFKSGLFKRRVVDGLVSCTNDEDDPDPDLPAEEETMV